MPAKPVKLATGKIKDNLTPIFNYSKEQGIFPEKLKTGLIFACSNYRPISILPIFSKIFENELLFQH